MTLLLCCVQVAGDDASKEASPRRAKWWYATFHNVTAMVGAGVLSLPYAMAHLGWSDIDEFLFLREN